MISASVERPEMMRSKILLKACVGRTEEDLESLKSSESGSVGYIASKEMGAHFKRNCRESNEEHLVIPSGLSATESTIGFNTVFMRELVSDSGSFSQSTRFESASGVAIVAGSLM